ncbi:MAG: dipeptidase [Pseudomonadales bacterium]
MPSVPTCLLAAACANLLLLGACASRPDDASRARDLAQRLLIVDTHIDVPYRLSRSDDDVSQATAGGDFDHPRAVAGGLDALFMSIYIPADVDQAGQAGAFAERLIDGVEDLARAHPDKFAVATCADDVDVAKARGLIALPMGMENGGPIAGELERLNHFRDRGIRYVTLTHSRSNHISDSSYDEDERWQGLSEFGQRLVPAMADAGVMVDVSHISDRAFWQVLELSPVPVIATHSSLRHFTPGFHRNMSDDMVRALGRQGGIVHINYGSAFLTEAANRYRDENGDGPYPFATLDDVLDHIDRAVMLAGVDHVGIGSDYDGVGNTLPDGLKDVSSYPNLVAGLLRRGYDEGDIGKILGANLMRVWRQVEAHAAAAGTPPSCRL